MTQGASGYDRKDHEHYETPIWCTSLIVDQLLGRLPVGEGAVWECCAGNGKMIRALESYGYAVFASDVVSRPSLNVVGSALDLSAPIGAQAIITNPPYKRGLTEKIIQHAIEKMRPCRGLVAMLLKVDFDSGISRPHLFKDCEAFAVKYEILGRVNWFPLQRDENGKAKSGSTDNHAWFVWDWQTVGQEPVVRYLIKPKGVDEIEPIKEAA